ncbi:hypothetical protein AGABI1DRAFT_112003 [Agaricus bisporus var. burnettii JB137-S8]|uniref:chitinase n=1 Tax=Agaricus bisporus var. burnettii (strain JB137-S8 / ATCC MYA-4627 / FGSC 10392) TaxID=597362 RepID=K5X1R4_AGABU|nr:uncharacterized protein AGABI1DRAFT_112003 [Agaricus bisporus var. burnettii JB137-S8]EKM81751.1 hypothetical protein AGABI1DRAFT_112003 [Agaricus bisporus var. burnettii JB137-S8]
MFGYTRIAALLTGLSSLLAVAAAPLESFNLTDTAKHFLTERAKNAVPGAPRFVVYGDRFVSGITGPPPVNDVRGFNVFALSFLLTSGPADKAIEWTWLTDAERSNILTQYHNAGIQIIVSAFGATDAPTSTGRDPIATANTMANFVRQFRLDGIDVDYEDFNAFNAGNGSAEQWLISFTRQLRQQLPSGAILTHAPVAPWFSASRFPAGGYLAIHRSVGNLIDWYNVQFYNQGTSEYTTCNNLLNTSSGTWPNSAVFQIAASGVPLSKIVIGKPATSGDASNGFMSTSTLAQCAQQARNQGWNGGVMVWQYPNANANWIRDVRSLAFPV